MGKRLRASLAVSAVVAVAVPALVLASASDAQVSGPCAAMSTTPIWWSSNPSTLSQIVTPYQDEHDLAAANYGFTASDGTPITASLQAGTGLGAVHRLYNSTTSDFTYVMGSSAIAAEVALGYTDQGASFYAAPTGLDCTTAVLRFGLPDGSNRLGLSDQRVSLEQVGWTFETIAFYAPSTVPQPWAQDQFWRTVSNGWGSPELGGTWSVSGTAANYSVDGAGKQAAAAGGGRSASLNLPTQDVVAEVQVSIDKTASGGGSYVQSVARRVSSTSDYRMKVRFQSNGTVAAFLTRRVGGVETNIDIADGLFSYGPGTVVHTTFQVVGVNPTEVKGKLWLSTASEPAAWTLEATDSASVLQTTGGLGLEHYLSASATNAPIVASFDNYRVTQVQASSPPPTTTTSAPATTTTVPPTTTPPTTAPADDTFQVAIMPDTQNEALADAYWAMGKMEKRIDYLVAQEQTRDIRWIMHTGDVVSAPVHPTQANTYGDQFGRMDVQMSRLNGEIPYMLSAGNHDTAAVCPSGSACPNPPGPTASAGIRDVSQFRSTFTTAEFGCEGTYETGSSENCWRTFSAGGEDWLVANFELWPRTAVITWLDGVIAAHPNHNVWLQTHDFLTSSCGISGSNGGYGSQSPQTVWNAIKDNGNIQVITSGHIGGDRCVGSTTANDGDKVALLLQSLHDPTYNPTRYVEVDVGAGTLTTEIVANYNDDTQTVLNPAQVLFATSGGSGTITGMEWV